MSGPTVTVHWLLDNAMDFFNIEDKKIKLKSRERKIQLLVNIGTRKLA